MPPIEFKGAKSTIITFEIPQSTFDEMVPEPLKAVSLTRSGKPCAILNLVRYEKINKLEPYSEIMLMVPVFLAQADMQPEYIAKINSNHIIKTVPADFPLGPGVLGQFYAVIYLGAQEGRDIESTIPVFASGRDLGFPKKYANIKYTIDNLGNGNSVIAWNVSRNNKTIIDLSIEIVKENRLRDDEISKMVEKMANMNGINLRLIPAGDFDYTRPDVLDKSDICQLLAIRRDNMRIRSEKNDFFHKASLINLSFPDAETDDRLSELLGTEISSENIVPLNVATGGSVEPGTFNALEIVLEFSIARVAVLYDYNKNV